MNVRREALSLLMRWEEEKGFANLILSDRVLTAAGKDAPALTALFYGAVERKLGLDYAIAALAARPAEQMNSHTRNLLRLGLYQLYYMSIPAYAAVSETVSLAKDKGEASLVSGVMHHAAREKVPPTPPVSRLARHLSVRESFPLSTVRHFFTLYGEKETEKLLAAFNRVQPLSLTLKDDAAKKALLAALTAEGLTYEEGKYSSRTVKILSPVSPKSLWGYDMGKWIVQDEASALCVQALDPVEGDTVIDVCAAPGGKIASAMMLAGKGNFYAFDLHESKLSLIKETASRLGFHPHVAVLDGRVGDQALCETADKVICDVPCSGLGVLGKKPDLRYRELSDELSPLGYDILCQSARYVKQGGVMVYSTCTLNPKENEENVLRFLKEHSAFSSVDFAFSHQETVTSHEGMLTLLPHVHGTDGFFMAKLMKKD